MIYLVFGSVAAHALAVKLETVAFERLFELFSATLIDIIGLSVLAFSLREEPTSSSSRTAITISCEEL